MLEIVTIMIHEKSQLNFLEVENKVVKCETFIKIVRNNFLEYRKYRNVSNDLANTARAHEEKSISWWHWR